MAQSLRSTENRQFAVITIICAFLVCLLQTWTWVHYKRDDTVPLIFY